MPVCLDMFAGGIEDMNDNEQYACAVTSQKCVFGGLSVKNLYIYFVY